MKITAESYLTHWPKPAAIRLGQLIENKAHQGCFAVFDMDNTSYLHDISYYMLCYLEQNKRLNRDSLPDLLKLIPFQDAPNYKESLYAYCQRLLAFSPLVNFPWMAQLFSGFTIGELTQHVHEAMQQKKPIIAEYYSDQRLKTVEIAAPQPLRGMQQLYQTLHLYGIEVFVVSASNEELVRAIACSPEYGYLVKPENVFGINLLLKDPETDELILSRNQQHQLSLNPITQREKLLLTSYLVSPMTWYEGKAATISGWIHHYKKPILVGGDSPSSDGYMLLDSTDVEQGGIRLWLDHHPQQSEQIERLKQQAHQQQLTLGLKDTALQNWLSIKPTDIA